MLLCSALSPPWQGFLTHVKLGDVKVGLDGAQFPCLIFQEHPQLLQSRPEELRGEKWSHEILRKKANICSLLTLCHLVY